MNAITINRPHAPLHLSKGRRESWWAGLVGLFVGLACGVSTAWTQTTVAGRPCQGQYGFVVRDAATGQVIARGWTTSTGGLGDGLVLGANRTYTISVANGGTGTIGTATFTTGGNGSTLNLPSVQVGSTITRDSDGDGVTDDVEDVFGTDPHNPSTLGGGIRDSVIVTTPPPPGTPVGVPGNPALGPPGIISSVLLSGICVDVCAFNDIVALACLDRGVAIFNVFSGLTPRQIALVDTPGEARAVGCPGNDVPVADGLAGLAIIDLRDPTNPRIRAQVPLSSYAESVAAAGGIAYVGLRNGQLVVVDLATAAEIQRLNLGAEVFDVAVAGDFVWAIAGNELRAFSSADGLLGQVGKVGLATIGPDSLSGRKRLFVGGGWAQASCLSGFDNLDVRNPAAMVRVGRVPSSGGPGSFKQLVSNGSGLGVACVGVAPRADGSGDVYLYGLGVPANVTDLITILRTPGTAYANTIYNGLDYVADGEKGLQVIRYLETDRKGVPPTITLDSNAIAGQAEEGKLFRITANATDDVQVRNVLFYLDGQQIAVDGNFPFEFFFNPPLRTAAKNTFTVRARAFDTGGNSTWSDPLTIGLRPDATPPRVVRSQPAPNTILGQLNTVLAVFSEPLQPNSVMPDGFRLVNAGADGIFGTSDDGIAPSGTLTYQDSLKAALWTFPTPLPPGLWRATINAPIADRAGNAMTRAYSWSFHLFDQPDRDHDGVPDSLEVALGLDPDNPDSKGDGIRDGDRDFDNDGLSNAGEIVMGTDPRNAHSINAAILDGNLDRDGDSLRDGAEIRAGTNPFVPDTDNDGWNDEAEVTAGSNPLDPLDRPKLFVVASPPVSVVLPAAVDLFGFSLGTVVARPVLSVVLPSTLGGAGGEFGLAVARPPISLVLPGASTDPQFGIGTVVAQPPVKAQIGP
jgi:hypothetical protein